MVLARPPQFWIDEAIAKLKEGRTLSEISAEYGMTHKVFTRRRLFLTDAERDRWDQAIKESRKRRKKRRPARIFHESIASAILSRISSGESCASAARALGVSPDLVRQWKSRGLRNKDSSTEVFAHRLLNVQERRLQVTEASVHMVEQHLEDANAGKGITAGEMLELLRQQGKVWSFDNAIWDRDADGTLRTETPLGDRVEIRRFGDGYGWMFRKKRSAVVWSSELFDTQSLALQDLCGSQYYAIVTI